MSQHNQSYRKSLRSALKNKKIADKFLDSIYELQSKFNLACDKLDADTDIALDTDYVSECGLADSFSSDELIRAQNISSPKKILRSSMAHKYLADTYVAALQEIYANYAALLVKLDAEGGTLDDTDYASSLGVSAVDPDEASIGQNKASMRKTMRSALSHKKLGDAMANAIYDLQVSFNAVLANLDAATINGVTAAYKVEALDPDSY